MQEPFVDFREVVYFVYCVSFAECFVNGENTFVGRFLQSVFHVLYFKIFVVYESVHSLSNHADTLLDGFFESPAYSHYFAYGFHA